jgi:hypothetical protein
MFLVLFVVRCSLFVVLFFHMVSQAKATYAGEKAFIFVFPAAPPSQPLFSYTDGRDLR